ncbi:P-loop containing nucleoside triphosphate hydrolase protein [Pisolithus orientalis]|uniref:P-loop containing nucleoside triphosphate hydrolase protein n=1 Tax=Pisolithus orientalis TaxID=936130 RepID=UPI002224B197|nr:P-loop containing nucleoside triphosphate hydrolase protein [Pisolithus orientalis]KAI6001033.1 P-loop containing nucleoside triphosphate hydrolase protein [Pisolithus orientalis]
MAICGSSSKAGFGRRPVQRKVVVCGDGACGKTSLLNVFTRGFFTQVYEPTVFENYVHDIWVDDQLVELSLWDTAGQEEFDRLRSLSYAETHVVMICFSVDNPVSLENVETKWIEEIVEHCPGVKLILVGEFLAFVRMSSWEMLKPPAALKCDLRDDRNVAERLARHGLHSVQYEEGLAVARRIRASRYLECSSKHNRGVSEVFHEAARLSLSTRPKGSGCTIM